MIEDFKERFKVNVPEYGIPFIWLKNAGGIKKLITGYDNDSFVMLNTENWHYLKDAVEVYTYLDGSPCGKLEE